MPLQHIQPVMSPNRPLPIFSFGHSGSASIVNAAFSSGNGIAKTSSDIPIVSSPVMPPLYPTLRPKTNADSSYHSKDNYRDSIDVLSPLSIQLASPPSAQQVPEVVSPVQRQPRVTFSLQSHHSVRANHPDTHHPRAPQRLRRACEHPKGSQILVPIPRKAQSQRPVSNAFKSHPIHPAFDRPPLPHLNPSDRKSPSDIVHPPKNRIPPIPQSIQSPKSTRVKTTSLNRTHSFSPTSFGDSPPPLVSCLVLSNQKFPQPPHNK